MQIYLFLYRDTGEESDNRTARSGKIKRPHTTGRITQRRLWKKYRRLIYMIQKEIRIALGIHLTLIAVFAALVLTMA